jgi:hypothetical protein
METKPCQNCKNDFIIEPDDFSFYEKMKVPPPTFCPECRMVRRMVWRNNRSLHKRNCDLCGISIVTIYKPEAPFPVYCNTCWFSDGWDPLSFGQDIDWTKPFFEQWYDLWNKVPKFARWTIGNTKNSDFTNNLINSTDCYLAYSIVECENIMYSENIDKSKSLVDSYSTLTSDTCYEVQGTSNYGSTHLSQCQDCIGSRYLFDCANCQNCFMSSNLRNKRYVFRNQQLQKEEYEEKLRAENTGSIQSAERLYKEWEILIEKSLHKYARIVACQDTTGNFIRNSKNAKHCFISHEIENMAYCARSFNAKDSYDTFAFADGELVYETMACSFGASRCAFSFNGSGSQEIYYSGLCMNASNLFGCVAVRKTDYCIFNKVYSKEEYQEILPKLIAHMHELPYVDTRGRKYEFGEFFPFEFSPFGYNESIAYDYYPVTQDEALEKGYHWHTAEAKNYSPTIVSGELPDLVVDAPESISQEVLQCAHVGVCDHQCTTAYRITPDELSFYKKMNVALPTLCPNCRYYRRLPIFMQPLRLWHRQCMCDHTGHDHEGTCSNEFETSYAPDRPEKVYCESCYQKEVL